MKSAIYIENDRAQIVLTPENAWEQKALGMLSLNQHSKVTAFRGTFFDCQGGWVRHWQPASDMLQGEPERDESLILLIESNPNVSAS